MKRRITRHVLHYSLSVSRQKALMTLDGSYPGERASPEKLNRLADFYRDAARRAAGSIQNGDPMSAAPLRLLAIQSIELNLSAFLLLHGASALDIRKMGHNLAARQERAAESGLKLRHRTAAHVSAIARDREYLIARYEPDCISNVSQLNRMLATMEEVATKVSQAVIAARPQFETSRHRQVGAASKPQKAADVSFN